MLKTFDSSAYTHRFQIGRQFGRVLSNLSYEYS